MREAGPGRVFCRFAFKIEALGMIEFDGTIVGESSFLDFCCFGDNFGVRGGEMGNTPVGVPGITISSSERFLGDGDGLLVLLPGGGLIRESSSSWEKLFSRYSLPKMEK